MSKSQEFLRSKKMLGDGMEHFIIKFPDNREIDLVTLLQQYQRKMVKDITKNDLGLIKSCMDTDTYHSYKRRDSFHKGWTALKEQLLKL